MPVAMNNPTRTGRTKKDWQCHGCQGLVPAGSDAVLVQYVADGRFYRTLHFHVRCGEGVRQLGAELDALYRRHTAQQLEVMRRSKDLAGLPGDGPAAQVVVIRIRLDGVQLVYLDPRRDSF